MTDVSDYANQPQPEPDLPPLEVSPEFDPTKGCGLYGEVQWKGDPSTWGTIVAEDIDGGRVLVEMSQRTSSEWTAPSNLEPRPAPEQ